MKIIVVGKADRNDTVEDLQKGNAAMGGGNYLELRTLNIVKIVGEKPKAVAEPPKKKGKKAIEF